MEKKLSTITSGYKCKYKMLFRMFGVIILISACSSVPKIQGTPIERAEAYFKQAERSLQADNNINDIIAPLSKAVTLNPGHFGANKLLAGLYMTKGGIENDTQLKTEFLRLSLIYSEKALSVNGNDHEIYINRHEVFLVFGRRDLAIADLEKALELDPGNLYARQRLLNLQNQQE